MRRLRKSLARGASHGRMPVFRGGIVDGQLEQDGWVRVDSPALAQWARGAAVAARAVVALACPGEWRHGGTWFAGVDALPSDVQGAVPGGQPLPWGDLPVAPLPLHPAQLSVVRPGYPKPDPADTESAFGYRMRRDAAHLDGILPVGPDRRRMIREPHAWVLGIGLWGGAPGAASTVVWSGSQRVMHDALAGVLAAVPPQDRACADVTEAYTRARRTVFDTCPRVELPLAPGQAVVLHRHLLHGIAPWPDGGGAMHGRALAWFRPLLPDVTAWLD